MGVALLMGRPTDLTLNASMETESKMETQVNSEAPPKVDPEHSGPRIFGSIIKDPPKHRESPHWVDHWISRIRAMDNPDLELHESVRHFT